MNNNFGGDDEILFERRGAAGVVTLSRPAALNALTSKMVLAFERAVREWENDPDVVHIVLRGEGRAFCAGGDIVDIYRAGRRGDPQFAFFADEYRVNAYVARYPKPIVSLYNGIVMGGGVGISVHGSHRVFTENAVFAMPEVGIGFFPDVGGSHFLSRLPGEFGMCMALTGRRVRQADALRIGLATHAAASGQLDELLDSLCDTGDVASVLSQYTADPEPAAGDPEFADIANWFGAATVNQVVDRIRDAAKAGNETATAFLADLERNSPTSLSVAFRQLREGAHLSMDECMRMEYRIVSRMLTGHDFYEGIRAAVIDKDRKPRWQPATLDDINKDDIGAYFAPLGDRELQLP